MMGLKNNWKNGSKYVIMKGNKNENENENEK